MQARTNASSFQSERFPKSTTKSRARLTLSDVINIFSCKQSSIQATTVANMYGVSEKAIRDIWTARTWAEKNMASGAIAHSGAEAGWSAKGK